MKVQKNMNGVTALTIGILLDAAGVTLITKSHLGVTSVSALPYILNETIPRLSYGTWYYGFQISLMVLLLLATRRFKKDYLISFLTGFCFSLALDVMTFFFQDLPLMLSCRILYFAAGSLLLMSGVAFLISSGLPIMPQDLFTKEFSAFTQIPYRKFKTGFDIGCVVVALIFSILFIGKILGIGIGTLVGACVNGYGIAYFKNQISKRWNFNH